MPRKGLPKCPPLLRDRKVYVVWGIKGGVGKSTISAILAHASATIANKKTLLIDTDFRDGSSRFFLGEDARKLPGWYDVLVKGGKIEKYVHSVHPNLHVIPSGTLDSAMVYSSLIAKKGIEYVSRMVANALIELQELFDLVVMDSPVTSFADIPILKCAIDTLNAYNVLLSQASIPEIQRTLKVVQEAIGLTPTLYVINQIHPMVLADVSERRTLLATLLEIARKGIKVMAVPFSGELYKTINWNSRTVKALEECMSFLLWGFGEPKECMLATRGLFEPEIAKMIASISPTTG